MRIVSHAKSHNGSWSKWLLVKHVENPDLLATPSLIVACGVIIYLSGGKLNKQAEKKIVLCLHVNKTRKAGKTPVYE